MPKRMSEAIYTQPLDLSQNQRASLWMKPVEMPPEDQCGSSFPVTSSSINCQRLVLV